MRSTRWFPGVLALAMTCCAALENAPPETATPVYPPRFTVGFLVLEGVYNTELTAPYDMFDHVQYHATPARNPAHFAAPGEMRCFTVGRTRSPIRTFEGLTIVPDHGLVDCPAFDILVVPSAEGNMGRDLEDRELLAWVAERGAAASHVISLCDGAFVLAAAGLLRGLPSTTFPGDQDAFEARFPAVPLVRDVSFVHSGKALTSVGGRPSFEVALYLIEVLYGKRVADGVAGGLVIDWDLAGVPHRVTAPDGSG